MIASPSLRPSFWSIESMRSDPKMRMRSSSRETKNLEAPGSPWRPERPRNWLSIRRLSCRSLPITKRPPALITTCFAASISLRIAFIRPSRSMGSSIPPASCRSRMSRLPPSWMSVPRPAMLVVARVQHLVRDLSLLEELGKLLGFLDAGGAHQSGLLALATLQHLLQHGVELLALGPVDLVVEILAHHGQVRRHLDDFESIGLAELGRLGHRSAGHTCELREQPEIILVGDRSQRLVLGLDLDVFLGL